MNDLTFQLEKLYPKREDIDTLKDICISPQMYQAGLLKEEKKYLDAIHITENTFAFEKCSDEDWTIDNIQKGASVLANMPGYLPEYIGRNARIIMHEFLGIHSFPVIASMDTEESFYEKGEAHLSILLAVIENLIKNSVNLMVLPVNYSQFFFLGTHSKYDQLADNYNTLEVIQSVVSNNVDFYYQKESKKALLKEFCNYQNLEEYLLSIKKIIERVDSESLIPNPKTLNFQKNEYFSDDQQTKDMILATDAIDHAIQMLKIGAKNAENIAIFEQIQELLKRLQKCSNPIEEKELIKSLKELLKDGITEETKQSWINTFGEKEVEKLQKKLQNLMEEEEIQQLEQEISKLKEQLNSQKSLPTEELTPNSNEKTKEELLQEIAMLKEALAKKEEELKEFKQILFDYLEHGGKRPTIHFPSLSNEEIKQLLKDYKAQNAAAKFRKKLLIALLAASIIGNILGAAALLTRKQNEAVPLTMSNPKIEDSFEKQNENQTPTHPLPNFNENNGSLNDKTPSQLEEINEEIYLGKDLNLDNANYYENIYAQNPLGTVSTEGSIIAYFPYYYENDQMVFLKSIRSQKELEEFLEINSDYLDKISWKAAFSKVPEGKESLEDNGFFDYRNTTFFIDFEPSLEEGKKFNIKR